MIVAKFGGSSVADASQFKKVKSIVEANPERKVIVSSACGKRNKSDNKMTDLLYLIHAHLEYLVSCKDLYNTICERFIYIRNELGLSFKIEDELAKLESELVKGISKDYLVSRGEYLTSLLLADYLGYKFVDAKDVIMFNYDGTIDFEKTSVMVNEAYNKFGKILVPGFYGASPDGSIKLMSRGGSDITGAILARVLEADLYENWTDVSGFLMADPRIINNPKEIENITYSELRELSYMGASVLHEDAIYPVKDANIPIRILNTNKPESNGTTIVDNIPNDDKGSMVTGIAGKKNFTIFTLYKYNCSNEVGVLRKALEVFEKYNISIEHCPSSIDNFSIVVSSSAVEKCIYELTSDLKKAIGADEIKVTNNISLIAVVGRNMASQTGASGRLFKTLGDNKVNIRMIAQGSDEINIIIGVENESYNKAIEVIYEAFKG